MSHSRAACADLQAVGVHTVRALVSTATPMPSIAASNSVFDPQAWIAQRSKPLSGGRMELDLTDMDSLTDHEVIDMLIVLAAADTCDHAHVLATWHHKCAQ